MDRMVMTSLVAEYGWIPILNYNLFVKEQLTETGKIPIHQVYNVKIHFSLSYIIMLSLKLLLGFLI
jgi:hypothetical protein